ncbi:CU044_2847 family protein [Streptomyces bottropensis]|uniref:CU044_2847 family protein n=1 Tax=Streptomyces bottropensis TaxID=42235 RepID=UPI0036CC9C18
MTEIVRFKVGPGSSVLVETDEAIYGTETVSRLPDGVIEAGHRLEEALAGVRGVAKASIESLRELSPETIEVEFGVKLTAGADALIAKASGEGHFTVKLSWSPDHSSGEVPAP